MFSALVLSLALAQSPAAGVATPPPDFAVLSSLDAVQQIGPYLVLSGWVTECRSGLQPTIDRTGSIALGMMPANNNTWFTPFFSAAGNGQRDDVFAALNQACPAVGRWAGYQIVATVAGMPKGRYTLYLTWATWDGQRRLIYHFTRRDVVLQ